MEKKTFAVMGATGHIGSVVVQALLDKGHAVRALGRNEEKLRALQKKGAETLAGAFENVEILSAAFQGADAVLSFLPPSYDQEDIGVSQDAVGEAIQQALLHSHVRQVVNLSSIGAHQPHGTGPIKGLYRHEQRLNSLPNLKLVHLRPAYFMENLYWMIPVIKMFGMIAGPLRPDLPLPMVATRDIGLKVAEFLQSMPDAERVIFEFEGPRSVTFTEATSLLGGAIAMPRLRYVQIDFVHAEMGMRAQGMKPGVIHSLLEMAKAQNDGLVKATQEITPEHRGTTSIEEFIQEFAKVFREPEHASHH